MKMIPEESGLVFASFAARNGGDTRDMREEYRRMMRSPGELDLPEPSRVQRVENAVKFSLPVEGGETESVLIAMEGHHGHYWRTLCVSSQLGCRWRCSFCETGRMGLVRNLTAAEIVAQRVAARKFSTPEEDTRWRYFSDGIKNIVFMGMGEPLDNFDEVTEAIRVLNDPRGLNIPFAQMTVSTAGLVEGIRRLAELKWVNLRLALSLNAADDGLRRELMPAARANSLADLQRALIEYPLAPRGRFLIEYVLLRGVNDSPEDARRIAAWCRPLRCVVNLIPFNAGSSSEFSPPATETILEFMAILKAEGQFVKKRVSKGESMAAACGQLGRT